MPHCCVPFCTSDKKRDKISFHEFPSDTSQQDLWLKAISRKEFVPNSFSPSSVVCGQHFQEEDYFPNRKRRCLKPGVVPSRFDGYPSYKKPEAVKERVPVKRSLDREAGNSSVNISEMMDYSSKGSFMSEEQVSASVSHSLTEEKSTQTIYKAATIGNRLKIIKQLKKLVKRREETISHLHKKMRKLKKQVFKKNVCITNLEEMMGLHSVDLGCKRTEFVLAQVKFFNKQKPRWPESVLRECVLLHAISPKAYRWLSERDLLKLPSKTTLKRFTGPTSGEVGFTPLIAKRLSEEAEQLKTEEKFCSLVIDEMAIKPQCIYDQKLDQIFGCINHKDEENWKTDLYVQADKLLCFVLYGLSIKVCIPCGYFFTKAMTGTELYTFTKSIIEEVEKCGFFIIRVVTDNHKTNVAMMKTFGAGVLKEKIIHPCNPERFLFFSFDPNHIIKNLRSLFLEKDMTDGKEIISGKYVKKLYYIQQRDMIKAVRNLSFKHIEPTNLEKMNVGRAVLIFSPPVVAALQFLMDNWSRHPSAGDFKEAGSTICFLKNIYRWFSLHDISTKHSKSVLKYPFFTVDDDRLEWLEIDFPRYLSSIKSACESHQPPLKFLTKETYEALLLTTRSTIACTQYLLENGYHYILTRHFNSDAVESLFSNLRQMNGGNDMLDVRSTIFSLEKILKIGIISSSSFSNVGSFGATSSGTTTSRPSVPVRKTVDLPPEFDKILNSLQDFPDTIATTLKTTGFHRPITNDAVIT